MQGIRILIGSDSICQMKKRLTTRALRWPMNLMNDLIIRHWDSATAHVVRRQSEDLLNILSMSKAIATPNLTTA